MENQLALTLENDALRDALVEACKMYHLQERITSEQRDIIAKLQSEQETDKVELKRRKDFTDTLMAKNMELANKVDELSQKKHFNYADFYWTDTPPEIDLKRKYDIALEALKKITHLWMICRGQEWKNIAEYFQKIARDAIAEVEK